MRYNTARFNKKVALDIKTFSTTTKASYTKHYFMKSLFVDDSMKIEIDTKLKKIWLYYLDLLDKDVFTQETKESVAILQHQCKKDWICTELECNPQASLISFSLR